MQELYTYFRTMADRKRFNIVRYLAQHEEVTVTKLSDELRLSQPLMSWHLRVLRRAGIVKTKRSGRQVWCSLDRAAVLRYQHAFEDALGLNPAGSEEGADTRPLQPAQRS